jgi:hypothetical protein
MALFGFGSNKSKFNQGNINKLSGKIKRLVEKLREIKKNTPQANISKLYNNSKGNRNTMNFAIVEFINKYNKAVDATAAAAQTVSLFPRRNGANNLSVRRAENAIRQAPQAARQVPPPLPPRPVQQQGASANAELARQVQANANRRQTPPSLPPRPTPALLQSNLINLSNAEAQAPVVMGTNQLIGRLQTGNNAQKKEALNKLTGSLTNPFLNSNNRSKAERAIIQRYLELLGTNQRNNAYNKLRSFLNNKNISPNMKTGINKGIANTLIKLAKQKNNAWAGGKIMNMYKDPVKSLYLPKEISNFILKPVGRTNTNAPVYFKNGKYYAKNGNKIYEAVLNANGVYRINSTKKQAYYTWSPTKGFQQVRF